MGRIGRIENDVSVLIGSADGSFVASRTCSVECE